MLQLGKEDDDQPLILNIIRWRSLTIVIFDHSDDDPQRLSYFFLAWNYENQIKQVSIGIKHMSLWRFSFSHIFDVCFPEYLIFLGI
jgi:hypothetical protein